MTQDPIARLLAEHARLMARFEPLRALLPALATGGPDAAARALPVLREVSQVMSTELLAHARREDDVFFPAVEHEIGAGFGPTRVMRMEHVAIHDGTQRFRDTLRELQEVDHPAIVAGGEQLARATATGAGAALLHAIASELLGRIDEHFAKEEQVLFPMSRQILGPEQLAEAARAMDALDAR